MQKVLSWTAGHSAAGQQIWISAALHFEVNVVVYSRRKASEMERLFLEDIPHCTRLTRDAYAARKLKVRFMEQTCRLLSPLL